jgi:hypothetical protein
MDTLNQDDQRKMLKYFGCMPDEEFVQFVDVLVYGASTTKTETSKKVEKFLADYSMTTALLNYRYDTDRAERGHEILFFRASAEERKKVENMITMLLSISHNRFRKVVFKF